MSESERGDGRHLSGEARQVLRERGARLLQEGCTHAQVAELLGVGLRSVATWSARLRVGGLAALREGKRGRRPGEQMALSYDRQAEIVRLMAGSNPDQLQLEGVLWTRAAVKALIERRFGVVLSRQSVGRYLRSWGWTAKKPANRWTQQQPEQITAWLQTEYPDIQARADAEDALILWADEMGVAAGQTAGTSYAPRGQRAVAPITGKRFRANVISAIANDGTLLFDVFEGYADEIVFMGFCEKLIAHLHGRKGFLIVDNHSIHRSKAVKLWREDHADQLELFFLPPYAPELNPDEYLNNDVHNHVARRRPDTLNELIALTTSHLHTRTRDIIRNYFKAPHVRYAQ